MRPTRARAFKRIAAIIELGIIIDRLEIKNQGVKVRELVVFHKMINAVGNIGSSLSGLFDRTDDDVLDGGYDAEEYGGADEGYGEGHGEGQGLFFLWR